MKNLLTSDIGLAARLLKDGGVVGMPTETVYGLGASATNVHAVARIFAIKGRPVNHPLILHIHGIQDLDAWASNIPAYAYRLAQEVWPGPLTLLLHRRPDRSYDHFGGIQPFVTIRVPAHPMASALLAEMGDGIVAPSANRFGRVSPTSPTHVLEELADLLIPGRDIVLDGGPSDVGVESTILDCTEDAPVILRPGAVDADTVGQIGGVSVVQRVSTAHAPGTLASHYAPHAEVIVIREGDAVSDIFTKSSDLEDVAVQSAITPKYGLLALEQVSTPEGVVRLAAPTDSEAYARCLYRALREADALQLTRIIAIPPPEKGIGLAVLDRLQRAAAERR